MGVPKFFRYISERYPCLSELVKEYQIPEFDNLYLDMNGIIHMCSHPNDFDPHFRITEERIFKDIFHYLEILFQIIKPRKLFFMAVDGVAPRAKMNQQRGRRFRSAKEAEVLEKKAEAKGEKLPKEARFDSNCITPGTVFMARLHEQLKYFVTAKMSCDQQWKGVKVVLSGHETPGEGEHKIMEYIRWMKTQPGYDPNTRHCLYGLDADLMMLGLCTHEPHFSLLREEVKFGKQSKRTSVPEETRFYLLHLSLMREYLDLEFQALKNKLKFPYDLESIIDDWVLMGFLVGNDFIPHLPDVHIANGALPMLYNAYIDVLPTLEGYINEKGYLRLDRFQKFMEKLAAFDVNQFKETYADMKYFESKTNRKMGSKDDHTYKNGKESSTGNAELDACIKATNEMVLEKFFDDEDGDPCVDCDDDGVDVFGSRVYDDDSDSEMSDTFRWEFHQHKKDYYRNKMEYGKVTEQVLRDQAEGYVRAIQWNLHYYYHGVASWSWYYPHHYAPYVSDICNFKDVKLDFELGEPFKPFEQLLAVLPAASKSLLPAPYRELMIQESSAIFEYYPLDFQTDLNGKRQDWEAVVLIPFIDEQRLLNAMKPCQEILSEDEKKRNSFGPMSVYTYTDEDLGEYSAPGYFSIIKHNHAQLQEVWREELRLDVQDIVHGLPPGVRLDVYFPGFPTFKHLPYSGELKKAKVQVFDQASRGDNMVLTLVNVKQVSSLSLKEIADRYLGKDVYCGWPHLAEAKVVGVADGSTRYNILSSGKIAVEKLQNTVAAQCEAQKKAVVTQYMRRQGIDIGDTNFIVYARHVAGRKYVFGASGKITLEKIYSEIEDPYAIQTIVDDIAVHDSSFVQYKTLEQVFPEGSKCFLLAPPVYGSMGEVLEVKKQPEGRLQIKIATNGEPDIEHVRHNQHSLKHLYMPGSKAAQHIGISSHVLSRITGTIYLVVGNKQAENPSKINIGLNLKFNKKNEEIPGFTRKENGMWLYSKRAIALIREYVENFPEIFEHLSRKSADDIYDDKDIYPGDDCAEKVAALTKWLKDIPSAKIDRQSCGAEVLDEEVVLQIQAAVKTFVENPPEYKRLKLQVKPHIIYKAELRVGNLAPDPNTTYQLFDRVVNVRDDTAVPLGLKGTIIGIHQSEVAADTMFEVLFDQDFPSSLSLRGSKGSAYRVSRTALINISHGFRQGLIHESYRNGLSDSRQNSAFATWSGRGKAVNRQETKGNSSRSSHPARSQTAAEQQPNKRQGETFYKTQRFKFPAPPNVQILPKEAPSTASNERLLWDQLQVVSGKNVSTSALPGPPPPNALPKPNDSMTNVIDTKTNVLKLMLGVKSVTVEEQEKLDAASVSSNLDVKPRVDQPIKQFCELTQYSQDFCGLLMNFFQRKGVGVPLYSVAAVGSEVFAELKLPDGTIVTGKPAPTKQKAAENAAIDALHFLKCCQVCDTKNLNIQKPVLSQSQLSGQISGQPQQFFQQFRQHQFPPPPRPALPTGHPGWQQSGSIRQTLIRTSFPQGPPPFPQIQVMQHPLQHQHPQPFSNIPFSQRPSYPYQQQLSPQKKQFNNHQPRREDTGGRHHHQQQQQQQQHQHQHQHQHHHHHQQHQQQQHHHQQKQKQDQPINVSNDSSSFVPLQALKKQRNASKCPEDDRRGSTNASCPSAQAAEPKRNKVQENHNVSSSKDCMIENDKVSEGSENIGPTVKRDSVDEASSSRSISRMRKSRLAINFKASPNH